MSRDNDIEIEVGANGPLAGYLGIIFVGDLILGIGVSFLASLGMGLVVFGGVLVLVGSIALVMLHLSLTRRK